MALVHNVTGYWKRKAMRLVAMSLRLTEREQRAVATKRLKRTSRMSLTRYSHHHQQMQDGPY